MSTEEYYTNLDASSDYFLTHETTLSEFLKYWGFHDKLYDALKRESFVFRNVLEIGGGVGTFAERVKSRGCDSYTCLDLSPALLRQQVRHADTGILANAVNTLPFREGSFNGVILNEVIADFPVVKLKRNIKPSSSLEKLAVKYCNMIGLDLKDLSRFGGSYFNVGAMKAVENVYRVMSDGLCYISEYSSDNGEVVEKRFDDHSEFSINFLHLKRFAESIGFEAKGFRLNDFLKLPRDELCVKPTGNPKTGIELLKSKRVPVELGRLYNKDLLDRIDERAWRLLADTCYSFDSAFLKPRYFWEKHCIRLGALTDKFHVLLLKK